MRVKVNYFIRGAVFLSILAVSLLLYSKVCFADEAESELNGIKTLDKDTIYEYDLNCDGKTEKIQYKLSGNEDEYKTALSLYINDKLCLSKEDDGFSFRVKILDLDKSDKYMDLFINTSIESDCIKNAFFVRYDGEKLSDYVNFNIDNLTKDFNTHRYSIEKVNGDGKFTIVIDTPVYSDAIGCYYCYVPFQLKDSAVSVIPTNIYTLTKDSSEYKYKSAKNFSVYAKAGSKKVVYKVKKGDKVTFDKMYITKSGITYFRIKNSKGKTGWIKSDQENLFVECPAWG
jgi:hypothetical protein